MVKGWCAHQPLMYYRVLFIQTVDSLPHSSAQALRSEMPWTFIVRALFGI
jgi:hypothetical protein